MQVYVNGQPLEVLELGGTTHVLTALSVAQREGLFPQGVIQLRDVRVNNQPAVTTTPIAAGDKIEFNLTPPAEGSN